MTKLKLMVQNAQGEILAEAEHEGRAQLGYFAEYQEGDCLILECDQVNKYLVLQLDDALGEEFVYLTTRRLVYRVPIGEKKDSYSPKAFSGEKHVLTVREARAEEIAVRKNLARNVYDQHGDPGCFPHAHANVETRGEAMFAARNAIDGCCLNAGHGWWPFESWGINMQDDAEITLEFGREVEIDHMTLVTRADFPHDNYWQKVTFTFSDGSEMVVDLEKSYDPHEIPLSEKKRVSWIRLSDLKKDPTDPSPFPALSQWEVYGTEV